MKTRLYDEYIKRLEAVNDETKTENENLFLRAEFRGWKQGVEDAAGHRFNGDFYYIEKINNGEMRDRPMCCGEFLDWKSNVNCGGI
jgi:hypothetical protein